MLVKVELQCGQKKKAVFASDTGKMLPCQLSLNTDTKRNLTSIVHIMKTLVVSEREIFLDTFVLWHPLKEAGGMMEIC